MNTSVNKVLINDLNRRQLNRLRKKLRVEKYTDSCGRWFMKVYVKDFLVNDGIYDEYKLGAIRNTMLAMTLKDKKGETKCN